MNNIESILYPALMLIAGIALSLFVTALEKRWDDWRDRRRKDKYGLQLAFRGGVSDPKLHCKELYLFKDIILIIGASSGIGRGIALELLKRGYKIAITARQRLLSTRHRIQWSTTYEIH